MTSNSTTPVAIVESYLWGTRQVHLATPGYRASVLTVFPHERTRALAEEGFVTDLITVIGTPHIYVDEVSQSQNFGTVFSSEDRGFSIRNPHSTPVRLLEISLCRDLYDSDFLPVAPITRPGVHRLISGRGFVLERHVIAPGGHHQDTRAEYTTRWWVLSGHATCSHFPDGTAFRIGFGCHFQSLKEGAGHLIYNRETVFLELLGFRFLHSLPHPP